MSLIPTADQGAPNGNYFALRSFGGMVDPVVLPAVSGEGVGSAALTINNGGVTDPSGHAMSVVHYVAAEAGGGLVPGLYQVFMYGPDVSGNNIGELMEGSGLGNNYCALGFNNAGPLDPARIGKINGTGAPQTINVPSIIAASFVKLAFVAGTPAVADPVITIVPNTSFSLTLPAGSAYTYEVIS